jgi:CubicO group peptidase (beta-lactamase class C family)
VWLESDWPEVTLRQLLTHTSGAWVSEEEELAEWRYCDIDLSEAVRRIREHGFEPTQTPGGQFHYSGTGLQIAAYLISQALGTNFVDLMQWYLFDRLGMDSAIIWCPRNPSAGGGASSSASDYMRFLEIYLPRSPPANEVLGSGAALAVRDMISNQIGSVPVVSSPYSDLIGDKAADIGYGLGVWIEVADRGDRAIRLTAPGHRGTVPWVDRSCGVAAILIAENDGVELEHIYPVYLQILDILNRRLGCSAPG